MQFAFSKLFAVVAAAAVASAAPANKTEENAAAASPITPAIAAPVPAVEISPTDFNVGAVWTDANKGGRAGYLNVGGIPSGCRDFISPFKDSVSSIQVNSGIRCQFFVDANCKGAVLTVSNGAYVANLLGTNFQDSLSAYSCFAN